MREKQALARYLVQIGLLQDLPASELCEDSSTGLLRALSREGILDETTALAALGESLRLPVVSLRNPKIRNHTTIEKYTEKLTARHCWQHKVIPLYDDGQSLTVAFANPLDENAKSLLEFTFDLPVAPVIARELEIIQLLDQYLPSTTKNFDTIAEQGSSGYVEFLGSADTQVDLDPAKNTAAPPIVRLCNKIIFDGVKENASDIHIEPTEKTVNIRFRIDGVMTPIFEMPKRLQSYAASRFKLLAGMDIAERRRPQDGRMRVRIGTQDVDIRASAIPTAFGEKIVLRLLRQDSVSLSFNSLGLPTTAREQLHELLDQRGKIILVTGPTGSGKTTTLYTCLNHLANGTLNIQTVEDPIEYRLQGVNQIQVNPDVNVTFATALRSILRQDPDVIMIGEIRDEETAHSAFQAAQTGHLVLSTLHTNDAPSTISRLRDLDVEPFLIASSLGGIVAQRLVRKICKHCRTDLNDEDRKLNEKILQRYDIEIPHEFLSKGSGCQHCHYSGYQGRVGLFSLLFNKGNIPELIYSGESLSAIADEASSFGYTSLRSSALALVAQGETTLHEVSAYLADSGDLEMAPEATSEPLVPSSTGEVLQVDTQQNEVESTTTIPTDTSSKRKKLSRDSIVLVEDNDDVRGVLVQVLEREMFTVYEAENGQEALELVYEHNPNIVLCDLMMPIMDGKEFLKRMKANQQTKSIPVIILTAADTETNEIDLLDLGANDFVGKTQSSKVMLSRIRKAMANRLK